jgi:protein TonB
LAVLLLALTAAWFIREQLIKSPHPKLEEFQWVKLIEEPPPPPEVEPTPEPEPIIEEPEQQVEEIIEEPQEAELSADDALGVDEEGQAGADAFGLRGRGPLFPGHRGHRFIAYGGILVNELERYLAGDPKLRDRTYVIVLNVWISPTGEIERCEIFQSSGNRETDERLVRLISAFPGRLAAPPPGMPQPIRIRIKSQSPSGLS